MARTRYLPSEIPPPLSTLPAAALRAVLREGYGAADFRADLLAGIVVGVVALPLSMALAIAVGVPPQHGLYTAIIAGIVVPLLGGSRFQVSGPTAAFVVILAPIYVRLGLGGLLVAGAMAGAILLAMGLFRLGSLIQFIPYPVTTGFTAGIGTVIGFMQFKDFLGLEVPGVHDHFLDRMEAYFAVRATASPWELAVGAGTLALLVGIPRLSKRVPAPLIALPLAALCGLSFAHLGHPVATIGSRFHTLVDGVLVSGIPRLPPLPVLPWHLTGANGEPFVLTLRTIRSLASPAIAIALLGAIESLLSAVVADAMAQTRHDPDSELLALGAGNLVVPFFGGIACTGAIARTATAIRYGSKSPLACVLHAIFVLLAVLAIAPLIAYLPMASLAALLMLVAWNMAEVRHFAHIVKVAPKSDVAVLLTCFVLTVGLDMVVAVTAGILLAALLFMRRMAETATVQLVSGQHPHLNVKLPARTLLYEINGPLFFGAAERAMQSMARSPIPLKVVILWLGGVTAMDISGLVALESSLARLHQQRIRVVIGGLQPQPAGVLKKAGVAPVPGRLSFCNTLDEAVQEAADGESSPQPVLA